jgi:hypothetical protein
MRDIRLYIILGLGLIISFQSYSQEEKWENPAGSIENAQVVIEKDKVINLRPVSRRFKSIRIDVPKPQKLNVAFNLSPTIDSLTSLQVIVRPKTMRDQPLEKLYGLSAKIGYGNYQSPFVLLNAGNKRNDEFMYNAQFNHFSSGKGAVNDSPYYSTRFGLDGKYYLNNATLFAGLGYHNQSYRIYGYDPVEFPNITDQDYLKQSLNVLNFTLGFEDNDLKNSTDQRFALDFNLLKNNHFDQELLLGLNYDLSWEMATDWSFDVELAYHLAKQNSSMSTSINRHLAGVLPNIQYNWNSFTFLAGVNSYYQQDPADNLDGNLFIYPNLGIRYALNTNHSVNLKFNGQVEQVTQNSMYNENLYLDTLVLANNNINDINISLFLRGKFSETLGYSLGYDYAHYKRLMFYDNNPLDTARFLAVLDSDAAIQRIKGDITYIKNENINFNLGAAYNIYSTTDVLEAWHKPQLELDFGTRIKVLEKLNVRLDYRLLNGIKARDSNGEVLNLDLINDLNVGLDLDLSERAGLFIEFRNIIGQNYQFYNNYPVNGFQVLGGFSIRF